MALTERNLRGLNIHGGILQLRRQFRRTNFHRHPLHSLPIHRGFACKREWQERQLARCLRRRIVEQRTMPLEPLRTGAVHVEGLAEHCLHFGSPLGQVVLHLARQIERYLESIEHDPGRLAALEDRRDLVFRLGRKHGGGVAEILERGRAMAHEIEELDRERTRERSLRDEIGAARSELAEAIAGRINDRAPIPPPSGLPGREAVALEPVLAYKAALYGAMRQMCLDQGQQVFDAQIEALLGRPEQETLLPRIGCPTLVLWSKGSGLDTWYAAEGGPLALWREWAPKLRDAGVPVAFVLQDGQERYDLPAADCYFVGGSDPWRRSAVVVDLCLEARRRRAWLHMGRVNSMRRIRTRPASFPCERSRKSAHGAGGGGSPGFSDSR